MKWFVALPIAILFVTNVAQAQISVDISGGNVKVQTGKSGSVASNTAGSIEQDVQMEGVAVINGDVFVDGEKIPKGKSPVTSKKSGRTYLIKWGKDGNVAVQEK